jgi:photosystem II stability/assembly factor-like uncharacterized protein
MKTLSALLVFFIISHCNAQSVWQQCNNGSCNNFVRSFIETPSNLLASGTCVSSDSGLTWSLSNNGEFAFCMASTSAGLFAGSDTAIYFSSNWGQSWTTSYLTSGSLNFIYDIDVLNDTVFAASRGSGVVMSADNGNSWVIQNAGLPNDSTYSILVNGTSIFVGMLNNGVYKSTDGGTTWSSANNGIPPNSTISSVVTDGINIYAAARNAIYISNNNGISWTPSPGAPTSINRIEVIGNTLFAGCFTLSGINGLFRSLDQGQTWQAFDNGLPSGCPFGISSIYEGTSYVYLGMESQCGSIYRMEKSQITTSINNSTNANVSYQVVPNLFINEIQISGNTNSKSSIKIYDLTGKLVINEEFFGYLTLNTSKLVSGTYYYSISSNTVSTTNGRLVKL